MAASVALRSPRLRLAPGTCMTEGYIANVIMDAFWWLVTEEQMITMTTEYLGTIYYSV